MAQNVEISMLPVETNTPLQTSSSSEKDPEKINDVEISEKSSIAADELQDDSGLTSPRLILPVIEILINEQLQITPTSSIKS